jgi:hypothetical protein
VWQLEIVAIDVSVARQPIRAIVVDAGAGELEEWVGCARIVHVADRSQLVVDAIDVISNAIVADVPALRNAGRIVGTGPVSIRVLPIRIQHSEIIVERVVLLQHEDDVIDGLNAACPAADTLPSRWPRRFPRRRSRLLCK